MTNEHKRDIFLTYIRRAIGRPYIWGGQSLEKGFDCSGLFIWAYNSIADNSIPDMTAAWLYDHFHRYKILPAAAKPGCLMFYGACADPTKISHVMVVLDVWKGEGDWPLMTLCGARGGGHNTVSLEKAYHHKAFVDVKRGDYWLSAFHMMLDPFNQEVI